MNNMFRLFLFILSVCLWCTACRPGKDEQLSRLFASVGVDAATVEKSKNLIIVPGYGCSRCIARAQNALRVSTDTLFIVICRSEKDFRLMTGYRADELPNVYLDKEETAMKSGLVKSVPMIYTLERGKFVSCEPFLDREDMNEELPQTQMEADRTVVDWGDMPLGDTREALFVLENTGTEDLHITDLSLSCECMEASYATRAVPPADTLHLHVRFRAEESGDFFREVYVYGNFIGSPALLELKGCIGGN